MLHHLNKQGSGAEFLQLYVTLKPWKSGLTLGLAEVQLFYHDPQFPMIFSNSLSQIVISCQERPGLLCSDDNASPEAKPEPALTINRMCFKGIGYMENILH